MDWILVKRKARPGAESRFQFLDAAFKRMSADDVEPSEAAQAEYEAVSISVYEEIGAPRVGIDKEATEWFREHVYEPTRHEALGSQPGLFEDPESHRGWKDYWLRPFEEVLADQKGRWVVDLAKEKDGLAKVVGILGGPLDFRGKVVSGNYDIIGCDLADEAARNHAPEECVDYARRLEEALRDRKDETTDHLWEAIKWLRFWGSRGFGYVAWA